MRSIIYICQRNRTGSTWLTHMLRSTGLFDWINVAQQLPCNHRLAWQSQLPCGTIGIVANRPHMLKCWRNMTVPQRVEARFIDLSRKDVWRQAISQYRAKESNFFHLVPEDKLPQKYRDVPFDEAKIQSFHAFFVGLNEWWVGWFQRTKHVPYRLTYERLQADPKDKVREILEFLSLPTDAPIATETLQVMRDQIKDDWLKRLSVTE